MDYTITNGNNTIWPNSDSESYLMYNGTAGNVGLGTSPPSEKLHINNTSRK